LALVGLIAHLTAC